MPSLPAVPVASPSAVADRLRASYGVPGRRRAPSPFAALVQTVLSQNTTDATSGRTFAALRARFARWEGLARANVRSIAAAIRLGGLADVKARYLKTITRDVLRRCGSLNLSFLKKESNDEALGWLQSLPGVGAKTARVVLLFGFGRDVFPVDTHVLRLTRRLGFVPMKAGADAAHRFWDEHCPRGRAYELHLNLIRHGREVCHARKPACRSCVLGAVCPSCGKVV